MPASEATSAAAISRLDRSGSSVEGTFGRARLLSCILNPKTVYQNIISAITLSLLYALTLSGRYTPLSNCSFVPFNGCRSYDQNDDDWVSTDVENCSEFLIHVQWLSNGTLVIFVSHHEGRRWRSISSDLSQSVTISPFGISALYQSCTNEPCHSSGVTSHDIRYVNRDKDSRDHPKLSYHKEVIRDFLRLRGITVPEQTDWAWLFFDLFEEAEEEDTRPKDPRKLLWPAQLCFQQATTKPENRDDSFYLWGGANLATIDPLAEAEQWFMSRESREKAEREYKRSQEENLKSTRYRDSSDDDSMPDINIITDSQHDIQGMNSVYPTPPDGFNSQTIASSADNVMTTTAQSTHDPVIIARHMGDNSPLTKGEAHVPTHENELHLGEYDNDDLFDEFSANGLTEADFNFFDQPDDDNASNAAAVDGKQGTYLTASHAETKADSSDVPVVRTNQENSTLSDHDGRSFDIPNVETDGEFTSRTPVVGLL